MMKPMAAAVCVVFLAALGGSSLAAQEQQSRSLRTSLAELVQADPQTFQFALVLPEGFEAGAVVATRPGGASPRVLFKLPESLVRLDAQPARSVFLAETVQFEGRTALAEELFAERLDSSMGGSIMLTLLGIREIRAPLVDSREVLEEVNARLGRGDSRAELEPGQKPAVVTRVWEGLIKIQVRTRTRVSAPPQLGLAGFESEMVVMPGPEAVITYTSKSPIPIAYELTPLNVSVARSRTSQAIRPRTGAKARGAFEVGSARDDAPRAPSSTRVPRIAPRGSDGPSLGPAFAPSRSEPVESGEPRSDLPRRGLTGAAPPAGGSAPLPAPSVGAPRTAEPPGFGLAAPGFGPESPEPAFGSADGSTGAGEPRSAFRRRTRASPPVGESAPQPRTYGSAPPSIGSGAPEPAFEPAAPAADEPAPMLAPRLDVDEAPSYRFAPPPAAPPMFAPAPSLPPLDAEPPRMPPATAFSASEPAAAHPPAAAEPPPRDPPPSDVATASEPSTALEIAAPEPAAPPSAAEREAVLTAAAPAAAPPMGEGSTWETTAASQGAAPVDASSGREVELYYATDRAPPSGHNQAVWAMVELVVAPWHEYTAIIAILYVILVAVLIAHGVTGMIGASNAYRWLMAPIVLCIGAIALVGYLGRSSRVSDSALMYGNEIGDLRYGACKVQIPESYRQGPGEPNESLMTLAIWRKAERPRIVGPPADLARAEWAAKVNEALRASASKNVLVFVHGYNNTFDEAAASAALLKFNLGFGGPVLFFSWPSQGMTCAYSIDSTVAENAATGLQQFLQEISRDLEAEEIHLVAHSMGNRLTARALAAIGSDPLTSPRLHRFGECILAAADIDATTFSSSLAARIPPIVRRVTLYKSSNDLALKMSKLFNGFPRVGDGGADLVVYPGMDSIDASGIDTSGNSHGYIITNPIVLADVANVLAAVPREQRRLRDRMKNSMPYWELLP